MKEYTVKKLDTPCWNAVPALTLCHTGWLKETPVSATAQLCHDDSHLYVRLEAKESPIRKTLTGPLDMVCCDSCLEFFYAPLPEDPRYFNFEWNPLGTLYLGFGGPRETRVRQILKDTQLLQPCPFETPEGWGITFRIPLSFLQMYMPEATFSGTACANIYKCGDETPAPHYLSWAPLTGSTPDYHRRQDFGTLIFE